MRTARQWTLPAVDWWLALLLLLLAGTAPASAHEGPPFPILMDEPAGDYVVSVWADPDIGDASFYIVVESPRGGPPAEAPEEVSMWVEPVSGRLDRATYETERQDLRNQMQFAASPYFDRRDTWTVGFQLVAPDGQQGELTTEIESTPPGFGAWDLAIYLFPFLLLGGLWAMAMFRRYQAKSQQQQTADAGGAVAASVPGAPTSAKTAARPDLAATGELSGK